MANSTNILRTVCASILFTILCATASVSQTKYYVDVNYTGGSSNGSQANPWTSLSSGWGAINSSLASGPVTVYFSARQPGSTTPELSTSGIGLGSRTNTSTNVLTLDGASLYNSGTASAPVWSANVTLNPCVVRDMTQVPGGPDWNGFTTSCAWFNAPKFQVRASVPIAGNDNVNNCIGNFVVQGFSFQATNGQSGDLTYIHDLTVQYNEFTRVALGSNGPGLYIGPGQHGPCNASTSNTGGPDNVTVQYNYIHDEWGECIYDGATTSDPPGNPGSEYTSDGMTCGVNCNTGKNHLIKGNTIQSCAAWSGQGDGLDIKDGHANLQIVDNSIWTTKPAACKSWSTPCTGNSGSDGQGIVMESGALVDGNFIQKTCPQGGCTDHEGIAIMDAWNNAAGRHDSLVVRNNIVADINSGNGHNNGIEAQSAASSGAQQTWNSLGVYNNTVYSTSAQCITVSNTVATGAMVENNICENTAGGVTGSPLATHDYNDYFNAGVSCPVSGEAHSICTDPQFVSTTSPFLSANFNLQSSSPAGTAGIDLSTIFTDDFFGGTRTTPWSMSAVAVNTTAGGAPPTPPTALVATVN